MLVLFCLICIVLFFVHPSPELYGVSLYNLIGAFSYQFLHANLLHLVINVISLFVLYKPFKFIYGNKFNFDNDVVLFSCIYLGSVIAALLTSTDVPTVGASGMVFFILGAILALRPTKQQFINYIWVLIGFIASAVIGNSNTLLHLAAFILGVLFIILRMTYDYCRTKGYRRLQEN